MILHLLDRVAQQIVSHRKVRSVRRRHLATVGLACPEMLEGRALLAGVVLPNLPAGSKYQIAFVTAGTRAAESASISNYNTYVTNEASYSQSLPQTTWRAWVSTATTNAQANAPTHDDVPIYNTRGELIATNKSEFLFPTHRATIAYDQFGIRGDRDVWTGSDYQGRGIAGQTVGSGVVVFGRSWDNAAASRWSSLDWAFPTQAGAGGTVDGGTRSLYAVSDVLAVGGATTAPSAPNGLVALPGNASVALSWNAPSSTGDSAVSDYRIQYSTDGNNWSNFTRTASNATSATVTGLTNGAAYVFRVAAVNRAGVGSFTAPSASAMPKLPAIPPVGVVLPNLPAGSRYQLAFVTAGIRPAASADINNYNTYVTSEASVSKSLPATTWRAWVSTATTNAQANAPTHDDVPIYNTRGELIATNKSEFLFPTHRATIAYDQFGIRTDRDVWTGSDYLGRGLFLQTAGSGVTTFGKSWNNATGLSWVSDSYDGGAKSLYAVSDVLTVGGATTAPSAPNGLVALPGNASVALSWNAPSSTGDSAVSDYRIQYSTDGNNWSNFTRTASNATSATVTGLTNGAAYVFRVAAVNRAGVGAYTAPTSPITPLTFATAPADLIGRPGSRQVSLTWTTPSSNGGAAITDYIVQYRASTSSTWITFPDGTSTTTSATVTGLTSGMAYVFRVAAVNGAGTGAYTATVSATPQATLDSVAGRWRWFNGGTYEFLSDGQVLEHASNGTIRYRVDASWRRPDPNVSRYTMTWGNRRFIDDLVLTSDLRSLQGRNQYGTVVTGQRIDPVPSSVPMLTAPRSLSISSSVNLGAVRVVGDSTTSITLVVFARTGALQSTVRDSQVQVRSVRNKWGGTTLSMVGTATAIDRNLRHITYQGDDPSINIQIAANRRNWGSHDIALMRETPSVSRRVAFRAFGAR